MERTWGRHLGSRIALGAMATLILALVGAVAACSARVEPTVPPGGADLTLYVRNGSDAQAHISIEFGPDGGSGKGAEFGKTIGISCNVMPAGSRVMLMDGPPSGGTRPSVKLVIFEATGDEIRPVRWLDIDAQGMGTVGHGVPAWWSGPPSC